MEETAEIACPIVTRQPGKKGRIVDCVRTAAHTAPPQHPSSPPELPHVEYRRFQRRSGVWRPHSCPPAERSAPPSRGAHHSCRLGHTLKIKLHRKYQKHFILTIMLLATWSPGFVPPTAPLPGLVQLWPILASAVCDSIQRGWMTGGTGEGSGGGAVMLIPVVLQRVIWPADKQSHLPGPAGYTNTQTRTALIQCRKQIEVKCWSAIRCIFRFAKNAPEMFS